MAPLRSNFLTYRTAAGALLLMGISLVCGGPAGARPTYVTFGVDGASPQVRDLNAMGAVTGYYSDGAFVRAADGTITTFSVPGASLTEASGINDADATVGVYLDSMGDGHGFMRTADGAITSFDVRQAKSTGPLRINNKGEIAGIYNLDETRTYGFVRSAKGRIQTFDPPGSFDTRVGGMNNRGVIVGSFLDSQRRRHAYIRAVNRDIVTFDVEGASDTFASSINDEGAVTGAYDDMGGEHGFVRTADGTITTFGLPDCDAGGAGINRKGAITGECQDRQRPQHDLGFLRRPDGTIKLFHVPGDGPQTTPRGINNAGVIAGEDGNAGFLRFP